MTLARIGTVAHGAAIALLVVGVVALLRTAQASAGTVDDGGIPLVAGLVLTGLIVLGVVGTFRWASGDGAQGERPLMLFDLAIGGMAILLITSGLDTAGGAGPTSGPDIPVLAWSIAIAIAVGVGILAIRRRGDEPG